MATASIESRSAAPLDKGSPSLRSSTSPPLFSPSSDKRFWRALRSRVDALVESRKPIVQASTRQKVRVNRNPISKVLGADWEMNPEAIDPAKRLKDDSMLLLRGFDSVAQSLSQLSNNLENALQVRLYETEEEDDNETDKRGLKRKLDSNQCTENQDEVGSLETEQKVPNELEKIKRAKSIAISMATKAASMARELKSMRSDLGFMQERCGLLEEENRKLRDGLDKGIQPDEDDLVRLQLEALLAEKSRLANENANLKRENQCLNQLVEYHQLTSQDLSASYENLIKDLGIDFSSPTENDDMMMPFRTPIGADMMSGFPKSLDKCFDEEL
ncbi:hypothetical protein STAS_00368 [Striga asiatica]|uniref:Uncharacterized protein n=1 Tax=Striga asiatica TaxID=4170 RepID=A0A5A7NWE4_STRAF|nr:hypothetical protein STAS_00368 [Striga asiatica]